MVQTEIGAGRNEWISYMRECSSLYKAWKEAERATTEGPINPPVVTDKVKKSEGRGNQTGEEGEGCLINLVGAGLCGNPGWRSKLPPIHETLLLQPRWLVWRVTLGL